MAPTNPFEDSFEESRAGTNPFAVPASNANRNPFDDDEDEDDEADENNEIIVVDAGNPDDEEAKVEPIGIRQDAWQET